MCDVICNAIYILNCSKCLAWMSRGAALSYVGLFVLGLLGSSGAVVSPVLPLFVERIGASYVEIGFFFSVYSLTWTVLQVYTGYLSDRYGRKRFVVIGLVIHGLSLALSGLSQSYPQLVLLRILQGVGLGLYGPAGLGLVAHLDRKGRTFALFRSANNLGNMVGPLIGGIIGSVDLAYPFFIGGLLSLLGVFSVFLLDEGGRGMERREAFLLSFKGMVSKKKVVSICLATFIAELGYASLSIIVPLFGSSKSISPTSIGIILSSYSVAFTVSQIPIGLFSERINKKLLLVL